MATTSRKISDYVGILSSLLCLVHCLIFPVFAIGSGVVLSSHHSHHAPHALAASFSAVWADYGWHFLFILLALWSIYRSMINTQKNYIKFLLIIGWILLVVGTWEWHFLMHIGSFVLILGHVLNLKKFCFSLARKT
ncbi:MAG: MerC domain-containing protein, partial [Flammeovirgaceae bacterium]|nr:MerC domain-containing protein [Flammeovirgaceae bacterium]MDW8288878.1 MerC domain-containing protein [Flammeovirgaceae bacterium]